MFNFLDLSEIRQEGAPKSNCRKLLNKEIKRATGVVAAIAFLATPAAAYSDSDVSYVYDALGRLIRATYSDGVTSKLITYYYDAVGNRTMVLAP
jgi:hypothetical protein